MKTIDKVGRVLNVVLGVIYIPLSLFSWLTLMISEMAIGATNPLYICMIDIFCIVEFFIPLLCIVGIVLSILFRKKGYSILSFVIQFAPIVIFVLNLIFISFTNFIPERI